MDIKRIRTLKDEAVALERKVECSVDHGQVEGDH